MIGYLLFLPYWIEYQVRRFGQALATWFHWRFGR